MFTIYTNHGEIVIELYEEAAPVTCANFRRYMNDGFYADTVFHRVIPNFMIQGGGLTADLVRKPTNKPIKNEADNGKQNSRGTLAMARSDVVDSATSQFFINLKDNEFLDHSTRNFGYAVFGRVIDGMDVVDAIASVATGGRDGHQDVPLDPVTITRIEPRS